MNIIPGEYLEDKLDLFVNLYNSNMFVKDILQELDLSLRQYRTLRKKASKLGLITLRQGRPCKPKRDRSNPKYYTCSNHYRDYYQVRYNKQYVGSVKGEENVKRVVEGLKECDWDLSEFDRIKREVYNG